MDQKDDFENLVKDVVSYLKVSHSNYTIAKDDNEAALLQEATKSHKPKEAITFSSTPELAMIQQEPIKAKQSVVVKETDKPSPPVIQEIKQDKITPKKQTEIAAPITPAVATDKTDKSPSPPTKKPPPSPKAKPIDQSFFILEKAKITQLDLHPIKTFINNSLKDIKPTESIPCDKRAIQIQQKWKYQNKAAEITLLLHNENKNEKYFLEQLSKAIDISFYPTRIVTARTIEQEDQWKFFLSSSRLKLIIASNYSIFQLPQLMKLYKETPATSSYYLDTTPLFIIPDISLYLKEPLLKASLWKTLKQKIQNLT
jgi:hypothetical protein